MWNKFHYNTLTKLILCLIYPPYNKNVYDRLVGVDLSLHFCFLSFSIRWTLMTADTMMTRPTENTTVFTRHTEIPAERLSEPATQQTSCLITVLTIQHNIQHTGCNKLPQILYLENILCLFKILTTFLT